MKREKYIEENLKLFSKIMNDDLLVQLVEEYVKKHYISVKRDAFYLQHYHYFFLSKKKPFEQLAIVAMCLYNAYKQYQEIGMSDEIYFDTMSDIKVWADHYKNKSGEYGVTEVNWLRWHVNCGIFKIGRLQYQIFKYYFNTKYQSSNYKIQYGEYCYNMHIQAGEKLDIDECKKSICRAVEILKKAFPKIQTDIMICHSWLLGPCNEKFMDPNSNIIKFSKLFKLVNTRPNPSEHFSRIFGIKKEYYELDRYKKAHGYYWDLTNFEPKTTLQKNAKEYIMSGGDLNEGMCLLFTNKIIEECKHN